MPLPSIVTWGSRAVPAVEYFALNHACFARSSSLRHIIFNSSAPLVDSLRNLRDVLDRDRSVLVAGRDTVVSPLLILSGNAFQDYWASYLEHYDVVIPVAQPPSLPIVGTYSISLQRTASSMSFMEGWIASASMCDGYSRPESDVRKAVLYTAILKHAARHHGRELQHLTTILTTLCWLERGKMHKLFYQLLFDLLPPASAKTDESVRELLLGCGILLAHDPFTFNAASLMSPKLLPSSEADPDSWKEAALGSLFLHAGRAGLASASAAQVSEIYINRLYSMLGFSLLADGCPVRLAARRPVAPSAFWHMVSKSLMIIMLLCLFTNVVLFFLIVAKLS